ncbi:hypothetical protein ZWY2020_013626 [Hordeum vulgare]|nr:hypothetical protein ZWY2020_013626 [Hordeum vulgare]
MNTLSAAFWDYNLLFRSQRAETSARAAPRHRGAIPPDFPAGTYYLAGPGMFSDDHGSTVHPLDGHGYLRSFRFHPGDGVHYAARYVETAAKTEEKGDGASWRFTHRGPFSVLQGGHRVGNVKVMKNVANTSVLWWGGRLLCLWEGGMPYELDPKTLETVGLRPARARRPRRRRGPSCTAPPGPPAAPLAGGGRARRGHPLAAPSPQWRVQHAAQSCWRTTRSTQAQPAAHGGLQRRGHAPPACQLHLLRVRRRLRAGAEEEFVLPAHLMIHDWGFTDSHYVVLGNRIRLDIPGSVLAMTGTHPMIAALSLDPSSLTIPVYLLPRSTEALASGRDWTVPVDAPAQMWSLHVGNTFEEDTCRGGLDLHLHMSGYS